MKLTVFLIILFSMQATADVFSQKISLQTKNESLHKVLQEIREQTGYAFLMDSQNLKKTRPVTVHIKEQDLKDALAIIFDNQPLDYELSGEVILVNLKSQSATENHVSRIWAYSEVRGYIVDSIGKPLVGATVRVIDVSGRRTALATTTDREGVFFLQNVPENAQLEVSFLGYMTKRVDISTSQMGPIRLQLNPSSIETVDVFVNTGYQIIPKERATGSFSFVDQESINRASGPDLMARLEGLSEGLQFHRTRIGERGESVAIRVRGLSTIMANESPLIVLDNFPYEGDLNSINPNDVESVTILKDAAAASIWGARAGNGVIVITTKAAVLKKPTQLNFSSTMTHTPKPDLFYDQTFLDSETVMDLERYLYEKGNFYFFTERNPNPYFVELLEMRKKGLVSEEEFQRQELSLRGTDTRSEALKYFYQNTISQQYTASVAGGSQNMGYRLSGGLDRMPSNIVGDRRERLTLGLSNFFKLSDNIDLQGSFDYSNDLKMQNGRILNDLLASRTHGISPYTRFVDEKGQSIPLPTLELSLPFMLEAESTGLLDWTYRPLDELQYSKHKNSKEEMRFKVQSTYQFLEKFKLDGSYQIVRSQDKKQDYYAKESYYVRNLVNRYTQSNFQKIIPYGGILQLGSPSVQQAQTGRVQLNYQDMYGSNHEVYALAGTEIRQMVLTKTPATTLYNYDPETLMSHTNKFDFNTRYPIRPTGTAVIPVPGAIMVDNTGRYLSYFGNVSYHYQRKYILSSSVRWDASNMLGVRTNQRGIPLWSIGGSWQIDKEKFFDFEYLNSLRLRATYGSSGNVDNSVSTFPIMGGASTTSYELPSSRLQNAGNPTLRWEKVSTVNLGLDAVFQNQRLALSAEYFRKISSDLLGMALLPPSVGTNDWSANKIYKINYADMDGEGVDVRLSTKNVVRSWSWQSVFTFSHIKNTITNYYNPNTFLSSSYLVSGSITTRPLIPGTSMDVLYAMPWSGLRSDTGLPVIDEGKTYIEFYRDYPIEKLKKAGVTVAPFYGSVQNTFSWKQFDLQILVNWYAGHVFRKKSISSGMEYFNGSNNFFHRDYYKRWEKPGDELQTDIPAFVPYGLYTNAELSAMNNYYSNSEVLVRSASHIRLQNLQLRYVLNKTQFSRLPVKGLALSVYGNNIGLLWVANPEGLDPIAPNAVYPSTSQWSLGLQITL